MNDLALGLSRGRFEMVLGGMVGSFHIRMENLIKVKIFVQQRPFRLQNCPPFTLGMRLLRKMMSVVEHVNESVMLSSSVLRKCECVSQDVKDAVGEWFSRWA